MLWLIIEWSGTLFGLIGAYLLANKKFSPVKAWLVWLISDLIFIILFGLHTGQYGLLLMHIWGGSICLIGLLQWSAPITKNNTQRQNLLFYASTIFMFAALLTFMYSPFNPIEKSLEWFGAFLSIAGSLLMASKHRFAPLSWIVWTIANTTILFLSIFTQQWGIACLQIGFTILNIYGCYTWLFKKQFFQKYKRARNIKTYQVPLD